VRRADRTAARAVLADHPGSGKAALLGGNLLACEVEVDPETGLHDHKMATVTDIGEASTLQHVEAQDEGRR
jgi:hypothetical protein